MHLWSHVIEQGLEGRSTDLISAEVVLKTCRATVSLLGNAVSYINTQRRENIIKALPKSRSNLASILQLVSRKGIENSGSELFGETAMSDVLKRVSLLKSFCYTTSRGAVLIVGPMHMLMYVYYHTLHLCPSHLYGSLMDIN